MYRFHSPMRSRVLNRAGTLSHSLKATAAIAKQRNFCEMKLFKVNTAGVSQSIPKESHRRDLNAVLIY